MSAIDLVKMNRQLSDEPLYLYNDNGDRFDISSEPIITDSFNMTDVVGSDYINRKTRDFSTYTYNGIPVPRVTTILDYTTGSSDGLMAWAAKLGEDYNQNRKDTLNIGSVVHETISEYLTKGTTYSLSRSSKQNRQCTTIAFKNFLSWYKKVTEDLGWEVEIFLSEAPLVCPWVGGTCDAIFYINGKKYLVDFKTSKQLQPENFIQISAYLWIIENYYPNYCPIDGIGLLRIDKYKNNTFEDIYLELDVEQDAEYIRHCQYIFWSALNMFYNMQVFNKETSAIKKEKKNTTPNL